MNRLVYFVDPVLNTISPRVLSAVMGSHVKLLPDQLVLSSLVHDTLEEAMFSLLNLLAPNWYQIHSTLNNRSTV